MAAAVTTTESVVKFALSVGQLAVGIATQEGPTARICLNQAAWPV